MSVSRDQTGLETKILRLGVGPESSVSLSTPNDSARSQGARSTKHLTIFRKIILSVS